MNENKEKVVIHEWKETFISGSKRTHIEPSDWIPDWWVGYGKEEGCVLEGTWWDMVCFARNILASKNTEITSPEFYHPNLKNDNYVGEERPYEFISRKKGD